MGERFEAKINELCGIGSRIHALNGSVIVTVLCDGETWFRVMLTEEQSLELARTILAQQQESVTTDESVS